MTLDASRDLSIVWLSSSRVLVWLWSRHVAFDWWHLQTRSLFAVIRPIVLRSNQLRLRKLKWRREPRLSWCAWIHSISTFSSPRGIFFPRYLTVIEFAWLYRLSRLIISSLTPTLYITMFVSGIGVANGTSKNVGLGKFWQDLQISEAFLTSLEISFLHGLLTLFLCLETLYQRVSGSDF